MRLKLDPAIPAGDWSHLTATGKLPGRRSSNQSSVRTQPALSPAANKAAARLAPVNGKLTGQP